MKLFGGYATPRKYIVFSRLALNSYISEYVSQTPISIFVAERSFYEYHEHNKYKHSIHR